MSRQKIFLIIILSLILLVLILAGVIFGLKLFKPLSDQEIREKADSAIKEGNLAECDKVRKIVDGVDYRTVCRNNIFLNKATADLDFNACAELDDKLISISDCQNQVMSGLIQKEKSLSVCERVPEKLKQICADAYWSFAAMEQNDPKLCEKTSSEEFNLNCQYNFLIQASIQNKSFDCLLFNKEAIKNDCLNYQKGDCSSINHPLLIQSCGIIQPL